MIGGCILGVYRREFGVVGGVINGEFLMGYCEMVDVEGRLGYRPS